jgi:flagellar M-ring protein FliF
MAEELQQTRFAALLQRFNDLPNNRKIALMVSLAAIFAVLVALIVWTRTTPHRNLFPYPVSEKDAGQITASLQQQNIPYKLDNSGNITVPQDKVFDVRLRLATQGLPKGGNVGFELLDNQKFGISQFNEQVNYQRAIEGELARSIESLSSVEMARVHLAMPKQSAFVRDQQKPTASVVVKLHPGRVLDAGQIAGIVHLVSSSVPDLPAKSVNIVDQQGSLLTNNQDQQNGSSINPQQMAYIRQEEQSKAKKIEEALMYLGSGNVRAVVTADVDFSQVEQTSEKFDPNTPPDKATVVSEQSVVTIGERTGAATGVPGALSNQPPGAATAPLTLPNGQPAPTASGVAGQSQHTEKTTNYAPSKTVTHTKQSVPVTRRLSAAVVVNYKRTPNPTGKVVVTPLTAQELAQVNRLVERAMGFNASRGDTLNVVNAAFAEAPAAEDPPIQDQLLDLLKANFASVLAFVFGLTVVTLLFLWVVKPILRDLYPPPAPPEEVDPEAEAEVAHSAKELAAQAEEEENERLASYADNVQLAKELAMKDPRMVATIIREWLAKDNG